MVSISVMARLPVSAGDTGSLAIRLFIAAVFLHFPFPQDVRVKQRQKV